MTESDKNEVVSVGRDADENPDNDRANPLEVGVANSELPRMLTQSELESLRRDMKESSAWAEEELKKEKSHQVSFTVGLESFDQ